MPSHDDRLVGTLPPPASLRRERPSAEDYRSGRDRDHNVETQTRA